MDYNELILLGIEMGYESNWNNIKEARQALQIIGNEVIIPNDETLESLGTSEIVNLGHSNGIGHLENKKDYLEALKIKRAQYKGNILSYQPPSRL